MSFFLYELKEMTEPIVDEAMESAEALIGEIAADIHQGMANDQRQSTHVRFLQWLMEFKKLPDKRQGLRLELGASAWTMHEDMKALADKHGFCFEDRTEGYLRDRTSYVYLRAKRPQQPA